MVGRRCAGRVLEAQNPQLRKSEDAKFWPQESKGLQSKMAA